MGMSIRRALILILAVAVALIAFGFRFITVRDLSNDHYMHLAWAQQVLFGQVPGRDFVDPGMPLMYTLSALVQWMSPGPFSEAVLTCALLAVAAAVIFVVAADLTGSILAGLIAALFQILFEVRLYSYPKVLVPAGVLLLMQGYVRHPSRRGIVLLAAWTSVAVLLRHDLGVYASAGIGAGLVATHWREWARTIRALVEYALAVIAVMAPYVVFVQWSEGLAEHFHDSLEFAKGDAHQLFLEPPVFQFLGNPRGSAAWSDLDSATLLFYVTHLLTFVALVVVVANIWGQRDTGRKDTGSGIPVQCTGLILLGFYAAVVLRHPIQSRVQDVGALVAIMGVWVVVEMGRRTTALFSRGGAGARVVAGATLVATLLVAAATTAAMWDLGNVTDRLRETRVTDGLDLMERTLQGIKETGTQWPWERFWPAGEVPEAVRYLNACLTPDEAVMVTWKAPEYYYFSRRRFGGGHAVFESPAAFSTPHDRALMIERLERGRVPIVLINETEWPAFARARPDVDAYLKREYASAGHFQIHDGSDVTIAARRDLKPERTYGAERWPCGFESRAASKTASIMLDGSATPLPAMSNAVP
jgi:hypothetical protein